MPSYVETRLNVNKGTTREMDLNDAYSIFKYEFFAKDLGGVQAEGESSD